MFSRARVISTLPKQSSSPAVLNHLEQDGQGRSRNDGIFRRKGSTSIAEASQTTTLLNAIKLQKICELDTARVHNGGRSEELLRQSKAQDTFAISNKAPAFAPSSLSYSNIISNYGESLKALQQDKVDIYYLRGPDRQTPLEEQCCATGELYAQGKSSRFRVSNIRDDEVQSIYDICKREGHCLASSTKEDSTASIKKSKTFSSHCCKN